MKINQPASIPNTIANHPDLTANYEGAPAFHMDPKSTLYSRVASCLVGEPKFYREINEDGTVDINQDGLLIEEIKLVAQTDPKFILQLAMYARSELHLRTISIVLLVEASLIKECKPFVKQYAPRIIQRADELAEAVAYLQRKIGHIGNKTPKGSMPAALKKGLAEAFLQFDEYEFGKYNRKGFVKLKDVLRLVHPKPKSIDQSGLFKKIKNDNLAIPDTWEVMISTKGSKKENWQAIIPKMGYMGLLRNLRNFLDKDVDVQPVIAKLTTPDAVKYSKQLPFRFFSAYRELERHSNVWTSKVLDAIEQAMDLSAANLKKLPGITYIASDNSGSMDSTLSERSRVTKKDIANLMLCIAHRISDMAMTQLFADQLVNVNIGQRNGILSNHKQLQNVINGGTYGYLPFKYLLDNKVKVDRILLISDMQCYGDSTVAEMSKRYKTSINPNVYIYSIDLAGYGTLQIPQDEPRTALIAGWSERILDFIGNFESDKATVLDKINAM